MRLTILIILCLFLSGCASDTALLRKAYRIDSDYEDGLITYEERQSKLLDIRAEVEARQRWLGALQGMNQAIQNIPQQTQQQPQKETYYIYDSPYSAIPKSRIEKKIE